MKSALAFVALATLFASTMASIDAASCQQCTTAFTALKKAACKGTTCTCSKTAEATAAKACKTASKTCLQLLQQDCPKVVSVLPTESAAQICKTLGFCKYIDSFFGEINDMAPSYAGLSAVAACSSESLRAFSCNECSELPFNSTAYLYDAATGLSGFVAESEAAKNSFVVSFHASPSAFLRFGEQETSVALPACDGCMIDSVVARAWSNIKSQVVAALEISGAKRSADRIERLLSTVRFTGQGFGAAVAQVATLEMKQMGFNTRGAFTFGTPLFANQAFATAAAEAKLNIWRFTDASDVMCALPTTQAYVPAGNAYQGASCTVSTEPRAAFLRSASASAPSYMGVDFATAC